MKANYHDGKKRRPKTAVKGRRYRCAVCKKLSPKRLSGAPYYCPGNCAEEGARRRDRIYG